MAADDVPPPGSRPEPMARLGAAIGDDPVGWHATVDGGHYDDFPSALREARLFGRSLFLQSAADAGVHASGPWLVPLDRERRTLDAVLALVGSRPAVVFWRCEAGETALWRHLRGLNMARIPVWAAKGGDGPADPTEAEASELVIFRHWDPRVLGALMPVLAVDQFARVLGPAQEISFVAPQFGGFRRVVRDAGWPGAPSGALRLSSDQARQLAGRHNDARYARMMDYIRAAAPETAAMDRASLLRLVQENEASAERMGLTNERSQSIWCFLMISSGGRFEQLPKVRSYLFTAPGDPNDKVERLLELMVRVAATKRDVG